MATRMCDLPQKLVGEKILSRIPITSLGAVRSTCKSWDALTKSWILGKATQQVLGFMTMNSKVCSLSFHHCRGKRKKDSADISIKPVDLLDQVEICKVFHCDGLLLCVAKDKSKLVVWNPYLCQTRWIGPRTKFNVQDSGDPERDFGYEIYEFSSNSWRVLEVTPDWEIDYFHLGVSVKGNTYFYAHEIMCNMEPEDEYGTISDAEDFLLCFDFTRERFGPRLPLPFHTFLECVTLSCVRDEQLAVLLYLGGRTDETPGKLEIWVTTRIEPNSVSWSKFLKVDMAPFAVTGVRFDEIKGGSFFVDDQEKAAVVFDLDGYLPTKTARYHTAFIFREDGFPKSVRLGEAPNLGERCPKTGYTPQFYCPALVCSYRPSLVQVNQPPRKRKERDV